MQTTNAIGSAPIDEPIAWSQLEQLLLRPNVVGQSHLCHGAAAHECCIHDPNAFQANGGSRVAIQLLPRASLSSARAALANHEVAMIDT